MESFTWSLQLLSLRSTLLCQWVWNCWECFDWSYHRVGQFECFLLTRRDCSMSGTWSSFILSGGGFLFLSLAIYFFSWANSFTLTYNVRSSICPLVCLCMGAFHPLPHISERVVYQRLHILMMSAICESIATTASGYFWSGYDSDPHSCETNTNHDYLPYDDPHEY